jgi:putative long chain acyl-CoA synthase
VFATPIRDALGDLGAVDLAIAYGVLPSGGEHEVAVAAVTLRAGRELAGEDVAVSLALLAPHERPAIVHVVDEIPVTTWHRPITGPLREAGIPEPDNGRPAWYLDAARETYRPLTGAARERLASSAPDDGAQRDEAAQRDEEHSLTRRTA